MKKAIISFLITIISITGINAQSIIGSWEGKISFQGTEMSLVFNISSKGDTYTATMDSPAQGAFGIPTDVCTFKKNVLTIEQKQSGLKYVGDFKGQTISGTLYQAGMEFPMELIPKTTDAKTESSKGIEDSWKGAVSFQGNEMTLIFHVKSEKGSYSSTMDSPAQGAMGIPMDNTTFIDNTLTIESKQSGLKYVGKLEDNSIQGTLYQAGMEFPLKLERETAGATGSVDQKSYNFQEIMQEKMTSNLVDRMFSREEVAEDVDFYLKTMHEVCPNPYLNSDSIQIQKIAQEIKSRGARSGRALYLDFLQLSAAFKAGHIYTASPQQMLQEHFEKGGKILPFGIKKENDYWVVDFVMDTKVKHLEDKVLHSINNIDVDDFITSLKPYLYREGDIENMIGAEIAFFMYLKNIEPPYNVIWSKKGKKRKSITLAGTSILDRVKTTEESTASETLSGFITFEMLPNNVAYLNVKSMGLFDEELTAEYAPFVKKAFAEIEQKNAKHLIVDLRENSGGQGKFAEEILPYFANKPYRQAAGETRRVSQQFKDFLNEMPEAMRVASLKQGGIENYPNLRNGTNLVNFDPPAPLPEVDHKYNGKVWCLIGPKTFSAGMMMANAIEDYDLGTLVGQPTGGIPNELSDVLPVKTPNSKIAFMAPTVIFTRANGDPSNTSAVQPDILVEPKHDNSLNEGDTVLDFVIDLINRK